MRAAQLVIAVSAVVAAIAGVAVVNEVGISGGAEINPFGACLNMTAGQDNFVQVYLANETNGHVWVDSVELQSDGTFVPVESWLHNTHGGGGIFTGGFPFDAKMRERAEPLGLVDFVPNQTERILLHVAVPEGEHGIHYSKSRVNFHNSYGVAGSTVMDADIGLVLENTSSDEKSNYCSNF